MNLKPRILRLERQQNSKAGGPITIDVLESSNPVSNSRREPRSSVCPGRSDMNASSLIWAGGSTANIGCTCTRAGAVGAQGPLSDFHMLLP